ncbi:MAG: tetratricopeptide repeat protein [Bacteroidales bacterium]|nr:tetratricopeptide repeat protein [Bacteroidales bacterium]
MHFKNITTHTFLTLGFMLVSMNGTSQDRDSLENQLSNRNLPVVTYLNICDELSWSYLNDDFGKAKRFALQGIERARSENIPTMEATLYRNLGVAYYMNSQMDSAQLWLDRSLDLAITLKDEKLEAAVYGAIGNLHNVTGAYQEALSYYLKALSMFESQGNNERIRSLLGNIGTLYHSLLNMNQAEKYYLELEKESKSAGDTYNLGRAYDGLSRIALREKDFDKSLGYSISAAEIFHNSNQQLEEAIALQGIAMVYYSHYRDYPTAKEYALRALKLTQESGYPAHIAGSLNILSNIHFNEKDYQNCRQSAREAIRIDTTDANVTSNLYANMVRSGIFLDNNEEALHYFDKYRALIDKRSTQEFELSMAELEKKYETEKKEMRISSLERERKLYGIILFSALFILVLLLLMVWFRQKSIRSEKRLAEQKILHLEQEKQIVATQAVLDGETAERTRLARDLHDGLGGMLSAVKLNLFDMRQDVIIETEDVERFNRVMEMLDNSIRELRRVAHNMMPESLSRYGLKVALEDFCHSLPKVTFHYFGEEQRINHKTENTLYRAIFELINNAIRHAEAEHINVQLIQQADRVSATVQDNGKGFDLQKDTKGTGLQNVKNRIGSSGGTVEIHSVIGQGTEITLELALKHEKA